MPCNLKLFCCVSLKIFCFKCFFTYILKVIFNSMYSFVLCNVPLLKWWKFLFVLCYKVGFIFDRYTQQWNSLDLKSSWVLLLRLQSPGMWNHVVRCNFTDIFRRVCCLYLQGRRVFACSFTLRPPKTGHVHPSETCINLYQTSRCQIPYNINFHH
jgi:hypothetical protein